MSASTQELSQWIEVEMRPFARQLERLVTIPGVRRSTAEVIIAATGGDKTRFRTAGTCRSGPGFVPATASPPANNARVHAGTATDSSAPP